MARHDPAVHGLGGCQPTGGAAMGFLIIVYLILAAVVLAVVVLLAIGLFGAVLALVGFLFGRIEDRNQLPRSALAGCLSVGGTVVAVTALTLVLVIVAALRSG